MSETESNSREKWIEPVITFGRVVGLFFDVLTLIVRLLFNVLVHDSPHGKKELMSGETRS